MAPIVAMLVSSCIDDVMFVFPSSLSSSLLPFCDDHDRPPPKRHTTMEMQRRCWFLFVDRLYTICVLSVLRDSDLPMARGLWY